MAAVLVLAAAGLLAVGAGWAAIRASGGEPRMARRYAAAHEHRVGDLLDLEELPERPVRVVGRVRCADPIRTGDGDALVAYHRDVEVELPRRGWRTLERLRETRSFELWDHDGSLTIDPARAEEPLVAIPHVWRGPPSELDATFGDALERLSAAGGAPRAARAITRAVSTVDRVGVLALVRRDPGGTRLEPPPHGFIISVLDVEAAMRLLAGPRRRLLLSGYAGVILGGIALLLAAFAGVALLTG